MRILAVLAVLAALTGCGTNTDDRTLTVLAASSLKGTFEELAHDFEEDHPGVRVRLVLDSSATLAAKAVDQAPGDVLATADEKTMERAAKDGGTSGSARLFASNTVELAVPAGNPAGIHGVADLAKPGVDFVTCVPSAPCGAAAAALLHHAGITRRPASQEIDVKAVLARVVQGEADAGLVYRTDVLAAGDAVRGLPVPGAEAAPNTYWVAATSAARERDLAQEWVDLLASPAGQRVLGRAGFRAP